MPVSRGARALERLIPSSEHSHVVLVLKPAHDMRQHWQIVNLSKRTSSGDIGQMPQFLELGVHSMIAYHVTVPSWSSKLLHDMQRQLPSCSQSQALRPCQKHTLLDLPLDILDMIFFSIDDLQQAVCLCLSHQLLFGVGIRRVMRLQCLSHNKTAGDRLVCLGEHTRNNDYPSSIRPIIAAHLAALKLPPSVGFYNIALRHYPSGEEYLAHSLDMPECGKQDTPEDILHGRMLSSRHACAYHQLMYPTYEPTETWVLCNLSKGVYVRADKLRLLSGPCSNPPTFQGHGGLAEVLLFRILWSSHPSTSMAYGGERDLHRGTWAGDRIEITTFDRMRAGIQWVDESEEALLDMVQIWRWEMGDEWIRERLARNASHMGLCTRVHLSDVESEVLLAAQKPRPFFLKDGLVALW